MAKTTDFLSQTSGKLTDQFTTRQTAFGTILARTPKRTGLTRRSEKQANMRCQMANMSANFKLFQSKLKQAWEGKETGLSEFNKFVQSNYDNNPVFITKQMRIAGACVLAESVVSSGSLPPIECVLSAGGVLVSDLRLGDLTIGAETTVADLSIALIRNNAEWEHGDQLTLFYGTQWVDSRGMPRAAMEAQKVVLDTTNETPLQSVVSANGFASVNGYLGMGIALQNAGATYVHSREKGESNIKVSSQQMVVVSDVLAQYQGYDAMVASAASYGGINKEQAYLNPSSMTLAGIAGGGSNQNANQNQNGSGSGSGGSSSGGSETGGNTGGSGTGGNTGGGSESGGTGSVTPTVAAPSFAGETQFTESTEVTISGPDGATIHYTVDGSTPTAESTVYSEALTFTETTTLKAIAVKDGVSSTVTTRTYTKGSGGSGAGGQD